MSFARALAESVKLNPYSQSDKDSINSLRESGKLAVDFYLDDLKSQYPPRDFQGLLNLIKNIEQSTRLSVQEQTLLIFYIFLAFENNPKSTGMADYYAQELLIPISWQSYAKSLYMLQTLQNDQALALLGTFPAPKQVIDCFIKCLESTPDLLCLFFDSHQQYLGHDNLEVYIESLCNQALFYHVLEIARGYTIRGEEILEVLGKHAAHLQSGSALAEFVSLPFTQSEWSIIQTHLDEMPKDSPAGRLSLVRALSVGDLPEINKMKDVEAFEVLTRSYDDY